MRTTLTLDPDVARLVDDAVHRERRPMKQVINDALRRGLAAPRRPGRSYQLTPHDSRIRPGFDLTGYNKLADELENDAIEAQIRRRQ